MIFSFLMLCFRMSHLFRIVDAIRGDLEFNIIIIYVDTNYSQIVVLHGIKAKYWMIVYMFINRFYIIHRKHNTNIIIFYLILEDCSSQHIKH